MFFQKFHLSGKKWNANTLEMLLKCNILLLYLMFLALHACYELKQNHSFGMTFL